MKNIFLFVCALTIQAELLYSNENRRVANSITNQDLYEECPGKFLEIHTMANNTDEAGLAVMKIFWLVDSAFLKRAANSGISGAKWGAQLGETFRYFCEKAPVVNVKTAAIQTINYLEK